MFPSISNAILATLIFIFLLLPGFLFLRNLWGSEKGSLHRDSIYNYIIWGTLVSVLLYLIWYYPLLSLFSCFESLSALSPEKIYNAVTKVDSSLTSGEAFTLILFLITVTVIAGLLGFAAQRTITKYWLDVRINVLAFKNKWFDTLVGREFFFSYRKKKLSYKLVQAHILCVVDDMPIIYKGFVRDYELKKDGTLDFIRLVGASRKPMHQTIVSPSINKQLPASTPIIKVKGDILVKGDLETSSIIEATGKIEVAKMEVKDGGAIIAAQIEAASVKVFPSTGVSHSTATTPNATPTDESYKISGETLVIKAEEIKNINCKYLPIPDPKFPLS